MNERIKDAWEKAAQAHSGDSWAEQTAFLEKFAELIVRECARLIETRESRTEPAPHIYLLKVFGVKE